MATGGVDRRLNEYLGGPTRIAFPTSETDNVCNGLFGAPCANQLVAGQFDCSQAQPTDFGIENSFIRSRGVMGIASFKGDGSSGSIGTSPQLIGLNNPSGVAISPEGKLIVADTGNNRIRKFDLIGKTVATLAGNGVAADLVSGDDATNSQLFHPMGLAFDSIGNLFISTEKGYIRKVDSTGKITAFAGLPAGQGGSLSDQAPAATMAFNNPKSLLIDNDNSFMYVADTGNNRVVRIDMINMVASVVVGSGTCSSLNFGDGGAALASSLCAPTNLGFDNNKNLIVVDSGHNRIRKVVFSSAVGNRLAFVPTKHNLSTLTKEADGSWVRTYRDGTKIFFSAEGFATSTIDRRGLTTQYQYDSAQNLIAFIDKSGRTTSYNFSGNKLSSITDPAGRVSSFSYNGKDLANVQFPNGTSKKFEYSLTGLLTKEIDQRNNATTFVYNKWNKIQSVVDKNGNSSTINDIASGTMSNDFTVGSPGALTPRGIDGASSSVINSRLSETKIKEDLNGFISLIKDAKGNLTKVERDLEGKVTQASYADGTIYNLQYDPVTRDMISSSQVGNGVPELFTYNSFGQLVAYTNRRGKQFSYIYDSLTGARKSEVSEGGQHRDFTYYLNGLLKSTSVYKSDGQAVVTSYEYDANGSISKLATSDGRFQSYLNDRAGNKIKLLENGASGVVTTQLEYDAFNRITQVMVPTGEVTKYSYLPTGQLSSIVDPYNKATLFNYDAKGSVLKKTDPSGFTNEFSYDSIGNLIAEKDANNSVASHVYNELNQLIKSTMIDDEINYEYGTNYQVSAVRNTVSELRYEFAGDGLVSKVDMRGLGSLSSYPVTSIAYAYDANSNRTTSQISGIGMISSVYDAMDRLTGISDSWGDSFSFAYDGTDRLQEVLRPGGKSTYFYNDSNDVLGIQHSSGSTVNSYAQYDYDGRGLPTQKRSPAGSISYGYTSNGELNAVSGIQSDSFSYDQSGNRVNDSTGASTLDANAQRLTSDSLYSYAYDNNGNLISKMPKNPLKKAFQYSYSSKNQLIEVRILASSFGQLEKKVNFVYDAIGRRIEKKVIDQVAFHSSTTRYVYDGDNIVGQFDGAGNLLQRNLYSPRSADDILASEITTSGVASGISGTAGSIYYLKDKLGSISDIVDQNGTVLQKYDYAAFGKILSIKDRNGVDITVTPLIKNAFTFTAREYDEEIDMYYYRARYYDANIGRFIQSDPDPGSLNRPATVINKYAYVSNIPTKLTDPMGQRYGKGGDTDPTDVHGNYCGFSARGQRQEPFVGNSPASEDPEDGLDNACRFHDKAYKDFKTVFALNETPNRIGSDLDLIGQGLFYTTSPQVFNKPLDGIVVAAGGVFYLYLEVSIISQINLINVIGNFFGVRLFDF